MRVVLFCAAESSALDAQTSRVSIFHVLEEMRVVAFPAFLNSVAVVTILEKEINDPDKLKLSINIRNDLGLIASFPADIDFIGKSRGRHLTLFQGLMLPQSAFLEFALLHVTHELAHWRVPMDFLGPPVTLAPPTPASPPPPASQASPQKPKRKRHEKTGSN